MYSWLNGIYCEMNSKYSITFDKLTTRFVTKAMSIGYIDSKYHIKKLKSSRTCLIGYSGFISRERFLIVDTHIHTHTDIRAKTISRNQASASRPAFGTPGLNICTLLFFKLLKSCFRIKICELMTHHYFFAKIRTSQTRPAMLLNECYSAS